MYGDDASYEPFWRALRGKARLVLSGHDHNMQRLRPRDGIVQLVAGSGGRELYPLHPDERLEFGRDGRVGALRMVLEPGRARLAFRRLDGRQLDSLERGLRAVLGRGAQWPSARMTTRPVRIRILMSFHSDHSAT